MGGVALDLSALDRVPQRAWDRLAGRRIYFGHQSVGYDIICGLQAILAQRPGIRLQILDSADPRALERPCFAHSKNGSNADPQSKFQAFANYLAAGGGDLAEVALYKLCYVDINNRTQGAAFQAYDSAIGTLERRFRRVRILHVTVPLTTVPGGPKRTIKRWLGRPNWFAQQNAGREEYNRMMLERFGGGSVFDLARVESTGADGERHTWREGGRDVPALCPAYSVDGGHLSSLGQLVAAREFLLWLQGAAA